MYPLYNGISICRLRLLISLIALLAFFTCKYRLIQTGAVGLRCLLSAVITGSIAAAIHHRHKNLWHDDGDVDFMREYLMIKKDEPVSLVFLPPVGASLDCF